MGLPGYLATATSGPENAFIVSVVSAALSGVDITPFGGHGFWQGGYQYRKDLEPDGGWRWLTEEPWDYTN